MARGPLIILSGPSGSGKSTVLQRLLTDPPGPLRRSVSATTRPPRPGEIDGGDYYFWSRERFEDAIEADAFLEYAIVHGSHYYGTLRSEVDPYLARGTGVVLTIDVQGADKIRAKVPGSVTVFLIAPSLDEYERRLRARGTEDERTIRRRLETARAELARAAEYQYQITNDDLPRAAAELRGIVAGEFERARNAG
ncbi:MAG TPA: guanylate kinase [Gemmataceae bacterium]|nr:guanylate kinase [Gemmataceae bacterium]